MPDLLNRRSALFVLVAAAISTFLLCIGPVSNHVIPFGDGQGYARRAIELYGFSHSQQWLAFLKVLATPTGTIISPIYFVFLLLPKSCASGAIYGLLSCLFWNFISAFAILGIAKIFRQPDLALPIFLLTAVNLFALDSVYFYHLDLVFMSCCLVCVWLQLHSWNRCSIFSFFWSGFAVGSLFLVKPANALLFLISFICAEIFHLFGIYWIDRKNEKSQILDSLQLRLWLLGGLVSGFILPWIFGADEVVKQLIFANQTSGYFSSDIGNNFLIRLFYFPLCLSYFYNGVLLGSLFWLILFFREPVPANEVIPSQLKYHPFLIPIGVSYILLFGLGFSFFMVAKVMRALLLIVPLFWICLFTFVSFGRRQKKWLLIFSMIYFCVMHLYSFFGPLETPYCSPESYPIDWNSFTRLPSRKSFSFEGEKMSEKIVSAFKENGLTEGKIGVGTEMLYWTAESLNWVAEIPELQNGIPPKLVFENMVDNQGFPIEKALKGTRGFLLILHPSLQYSDKVFQFNQRFASYLNSGKLSLLKSQTLLAEDNQPLAMFALLKQPISDEQLSRLMAEVAPQGYSSFFHETEMIKKSPLLKILEN